MRRAASIHLAAVITVAGLAVASLAACGGRTDPAGPADDVAEYSDLSWDAQALQTVGFATDQLPAINDGPDPAASEKPNRKRHPKFRRLRFGFHRGVLHGEATVRTDEGTKTVVVQRGSVTAFTDTSITVKSTDGYTLTWSLGDKLRVFERRKQVQPKDVAVGTKIGLAGEKDGDGAVARLIVVDAR